MAVHDSGDEAVALPGARSAQNKQVMAVTKAMDAVGAVVFFEKPLTSSDASATGRMVIPKAIAEQYFPRLEQQNGILVRAEDTHGKEYSFKFRFWINNQVSRMYLLEGAGDLHRAYAMAVGDIMVFAQKPDGSLVVAGRPSMQGDVVKRAQVKRPSGRVEGGPAEWHEQKPRRPQGGAPKTKKRGKTDPFANVLAGTEPPVDGVFRAVQHGQGAQPGGVHTSKSGRWTVCLSIVGELYQAFFESQEDALEAFKAAGSSPTVPLPA